MGAISAIVTGLSAHKQHKASKKAAKQAKSLAAEQAERQAQQDKIISDKEKLKAKQVGARLKASAGARSGRRSLISGSETGLRENLG